jgi:predicted aspartyl protease
VTLALALLGPTTAREQEEEEKEVEAPLHLMVPVDLRWGKESNGFLPYSALVDTGATYNFVSQSVADSIGM